MSESLDRYLTTPPEEKEEATQEDHLSDLLTVQESIEATLQQLGNVIDKQVELLTAIHEELQAIRGSVERE